MAGSILISMFGCLNGLVLSGARVYQRMAEDGLFYPGAARLNEHGVPAFGLWIQALWTCLLTLTGTYGSASNEVSNLFSTPARTWSIGAGLFGPILDGGRYRARTDQAVAQAKQAEGVYRGAVQNAFRDVLDALSNTKRAAETEESLKSMVEQAGKALHLAEVRYEHGYSAYLEVLDAQRTLNDAQLTLIRNRQAYLSYTVDLMNALGGGWVPAT